MKKKSDAMKTYILDLRDGGQRKVTVPATWKCTFGPVCPGSRNDNGSSQTALRFYEGKEQQRAVFTGVTAFRDDSILVMERVTKTQSQTAYKDTPKGRKSFLVEANVSNWQNPDEPDAPDEEFLKLPSAPTAF